MRSPGVADRCLGQDHGATHAHPPLDHHDGPAVTMPEPLISAAPRLRDGIREGRPAQLERPGAPGTPDPPRFCARVTRDPCKDIVEILKRDERLGDGLFQVPTHETSVWGGIFLLANIRMYGYSTPP